MSRLSDQQAYNRAGGINKNSYTSESFLTRSAPRTFKNTFNNIKQNTLPRAETKLKEKLDGMTPVLSDSQLKVLNEHKYSSTGSTLLDPLFQPYWRWLVLQMPLYLAPNLITVIGLIINVITSSILMLYSPNAKDTVN